MSVTLIVGGQWGDEGKAKIIDILARDADYVVRFQGGANAGHTVVVGKECFKFHLVPSGILYPDITCVLGGGMVIDPLALAEEIEFIKSRGIDVRDRIFVSEQAHVVLPHHILMDRSQEAKKGSGKIGSTGRGITPAYMDKVGREGMRMGEFLRSSEEFRSIVRKKVTEKNRLLRLFGFPAISPSKTEKDFLAARRKLKPLIADTRIMLWDAIEKNKRIFCEGAQGALLDVDHGTYPFVTSSSAIAGGAAVGAGLPPSSIRRIIGVLKAYCTRVGNGPFPTEDKGKNGDRLRDLGQEYGTTTGRPRRCGWFDAVAARTTTKLNGVTEIALTKLDILVGFDKIKICTAYRIGKKRIEYFPTDSRILAKCRPEYEVIDGWKTPTLVGGSLRLSKQAEHYVQLLEKLIGCKITMVSLGPERHAVVQR
ncbi:MAG: adenylosuccinate synthase [Candidatus Latescibacteria bacterium]|nr:adenylosuccinate synthase [Candidatus Latescibacterota bacterium]NIM22104.1 adenylosuccinate synthase [Candidatus Latescibacterota bacterium]NIM64654.1 adenylosuccinate synthase [Candidatus Latescibacterota bacterium]NIO01164.1 adenylosuccinate synthase [Candidatus Latescibacterota bacterium]NIO27549.1 adenylosuccinate synthase [Candidatus Latescibacterota bacterium]